MSRGQYSQRCVDVMKTKLLGLLRWSSLSRSRHNFQLSWLPRRSVSFAAASKWDASLLYHPIDPDLDAETLGKQLVSLVHEGRYGAADRLRYRLMDGDVRIEQHTVYESAALAALQLSDPEKRMSDFTVWSTLVPDKDNPCTTPHVFRDTRTALLLQGSPSMDLPLVERFGIITVAKGYRKYFPNIARVVTSFAPTAKHMINFFLEAGERATEYARHYHPDEAKETSQWFRQAGVEISAHTGKLGVALDLLKLKRDFLMPDSTYELMLLKLIESQKQGGKGAPVTNPSNSVELVHKLQLRDSRARRGLNDTNGKSTRQVNMEGLATVNQKNKGAILL